MRTPAGGPCSAVMPLAAPPCAPPSLARSRSRAPIFIKEDLANGLLDAAITSASFSLALGFHPIVPALAFLDGVAGRHLAKLRARIAFSAGGGLASNAAALAAHAAIGALKMGAILNPIAGFGVPWRAIATVSVANSLSKGSFRLVFDKACVNEREPRRAAAVACGSLIGFAQGLLTGLVYRGSPGAAVMQAVIATAGLGLLFHTNSGAGRSWPTASLLLAQKTRLN